jgi:hypothetical protein
MRGMRFRGESDVPAPPPQIPRSNERTVLQKPLNTNGLTQSQLYPAGQILLNSMVVKGWIELHPDGKTYYKTAAGEQAMKTKLRVR